MKVGQVGKSIEQVLVESVLGEKRAKAAHKRLLYPHARLVVPISSKIFVRRWLRIKHGSWFQVHRDGHDDMVHPYASDTAEPERMAWIALAIACSGIKGPGCLGIHLDQIGGKHG